MISFEEYAVFTEGGILFIKLENNMIAWCIWFDDDWWTIGHEHVIYTSAVFSWNILVLVCCAVVV